MRQFTEESPIESCFNRRDCPMIRFRNKKDIEYFINKGEKYDALIERKPSDKFIIAWSGRYKTDVFEITKKDIKEILGNNF